MNTVSKSLVRKWPGAVLALLLSGGARAHENVSAEYGSFLGGLSHPVLGIDHFLAMVCVGILSAQIGGRAIWTVPATFVIVMALGGLLGMNDVGLGAIELGIASSVLVLGLAIAADRRFPVMLVLAAVGFFAVFHGYAHGLEMPTVANPVEYSIGFMTGTAGLHLLGVLIGDIARRYARGHTVMRVIGGAVAGIGAWYITGTLA